MSIEAVVFDFGNVIGFFEHRRGIEKLAERLDIDIDAVHRALHEPDLAIPYECGTMSTADFFAGIRQRAGFECDDETMLECLSDIFWPNEEICEVIHRLSSTNKLYLLSNTCEMHADRFLIDYRETFAPFKTLFLSHQIGFIKPGLEVYEHVQREIGIASESIVFIDDRPENIEGAKSCGWHGILFESVPALNAELQSHGIA